MLHRNLSTSCSVDNFSEKNITGVLEFIAILLAIDIANAVLPTPGLPEIVITSPPWKPLVALSIKEKPDNNPKLFYLYLPSALSSRKLYNL